MLRGLITFLALLSLLLCGSLVRLQLLAKSTGEIDILSVHVRSWHARYTLRANATCIMLQGPPEQSAPSSRQGQPSVASLVAQMHNSEIIWVARQYTDSGDWAQCESYYSTTEASRPIYDAFWAAHDADCLPALLDAAEDEDKALFAHCILASKCGERLWRKWEHLKDQYELAVPTDDSHVLCFDGVQIKLLDRISKIDGPWIAPCLSDGLGQRGGHSQKCQIC